MFLDAKIHHFFSVSPPTWCCLEKLQQVIRQWHRDFCTGAATRELPAPVPRRVDFFEGQTAKAGQGAQAILGGWEVLEMLGGFMEDLVWNILGLSSLNRINTWLSMDW